jgi:hypothetical protein
MRGDRVLPDFFMPMLSTSDVGDTCYGYHRTSTWHNRAIGMSMALSVD